MTKFDRDFSSKNLRVPLAVQKRSERCSRLPLYLLLRCAFFLFIKLLRMKPEAAGPLIQAPVVSRSNSCAPSSQRRARSLLRHLRFCAVSAAPSTMVEFRTRRVCGLRRRRGDPTAPRIPLHKMLARMQEDSGAVSAHSQCAHPRAPRSLCAGRGAHW